ncbi:hypothetical protein [Sphingomonas koreensis]|nr:hypothetical protein [Sphingomonas koreensis]
MDVERHGKTEAEAHGEMLPADRGRDCDQARGDPRRSAPSGK